ncbi:CPBP family intramembrane glutamic endopeptidase [Halovivax gelatinilyticus]|uniref:CPBP family intramembrane glutamic endopeptidase n=1 Tax=Halovivax gelatinilyticus TaxID=2961597 RepID=UPI0020CA4137|nr:type II CAAX endopeptidase family protein [Halovivax gelatinilyticus]
MSDAAGDDSTIDLPSGVEPVRNDPDGAVVALALFAGTLSLLGATGPVRAGTTDPLSITLTGLAAVALLSLVALRFRHVSTRVGGSVSTLASFLVGLLSVYGLNQGLDGGFGVPPIEATPALFVAVLGAGATLALGVSIAVGLSRGAIRERFVATAQYSLVGVAGILAINVWAIVLVAVGTPVLPAESPAELTAVDVAVLSQVATVFGIGTVTIGVLVWTGRDGSFIDLSVPSVRDLGYVVGGVLAIVAAAIAINTLLGATGTEGTDHSSFERAAGAPELLLVLAVASIVVIGPFEELLFRNVIQKSLYEYFSRPGAIVVASVPFAVVHASAYAGGTVGQSLVSLGVVGSLSILLGTLYERTDNLLVPALVHGLYNAYVFYTAYLAMTA